MDGPPPHRPARSGGTAEAAAEAAVERLVDAVASRDERAVDQLLRLALLLSGAEAVSLWRPLGAAAAWWPVRRAGTDTRRVDEARVVAARLAGLELGGDQVAATGPWPGRQGPWCLVASGPGSGASDDGLAGAAALWCALTDDSPGAGDPLPGPAGRPPGDPGGATR